MRYLFLKPEEHGEKSIKKQTQPTPPISETDYLRI
ncbi:MAG: hypothetical protein ACI828_002322 [Flavobacteriales bacterium]|jgi:hypothetical protein